MAKPKADWGTRLAHRVKLRDLHVLAEVVRLRGMAKAAPHLGMSQAAVSEAIASLERALSVKLLERSSQGIVPTIYADALLKRGQAMFDELRQGIRDIEFLADPSAGEVRVACAEMPAAGLVPAAIDLLSRNNSQVIVRVAHTVPAIGASGLDFPELRERKVDLVVTGIHGLCEEQDIEVEHLFPDPNYVVVGLSSRWTKRRKVELSDLIGEPWIFPPNPVIVKMIREAFETKNLEPPAERVSASSIPLRNHLLATGRYLTILTSSVLHFNGDRWGLKALPVDLEVTPPTIAILTLKGRILNPAVGMFIQHLRDAAQPMKVLTKSNR
jgi:DNA-binding transcriptional LysR family regulator